jgi:hypothetical protein
MGSQEFFCFFFEKTSFFRQIALLTREIKKKTRFWQVKRHLPSPHALLELSEIAYEAK